MSLLTAVTVRLFTYLCSPTPSPLTIFKPVSLQISRTRLNSRSFSATSTTNPLLCLPGDAPHLLGLPCVEPCLVYLQAHAAAIAAGTCPLCVTFNDASSRAEWVVVRGSPHDKYSSSPRDASFGGLSPHVLVNGPAALLVGPATPWAAASVPAITLSVSVCRSTPTDSAADYASLRVYYLPAGAPVFSRNPMSSALARPSGLPAPDNSAQALGLGESFSDEWSVTVRVPATCSPVDVEVLLAGARGYSGTLMQLGLGLLGEDDGVALAVASISSEVTGTLRGCNGPFLDSPLFDVQRWVGVYRSRAAVTCRASGHKNVWWGPSAPKSHCKRVRCLPAFLVSWRLRCKSQL